MKIIPILPKWKTTSCFFILLATCVLISASLAHVKRLLPPSVQQNVSYELARKVAIYYAEVRWGNVRIGQGELYYAPDGTPEVYFFIVFKKDTAEKPISEIMEETATLRNRRVEVEKSIKNVPTKVAKERAITIKNLWEQMSAPDKYGTVIVGAHEGREPFIGSYSGLPPHILLREDAIETARSKLNREGPEDVRHIWQPPLFIAFEISEETEELKNVFLEVRGTNLHQIKTPRWERPRLQDKVLQKRKQKWQSWRGALSDN